MEPRFKPLSEEAELNHWEVFWLLPETTHISFKRGKVKGWSLLNPPLSKDYRSSRNRRFIQKEGNSFCLFGFENRLSGYYYGPIAWAWRCRNCREIVKRKSLLDSKEICRRCNDGFVKRRRIPL